ncbi:sulfite exporter TauE/SafE family protein [uncultured Pelagimonas sp.]|uniref:sulfite exporter TauE/SafE family protein n=1 Tax=uncultured Pelagimonas sp. TaxID=1618102 RepID=UPI0026215516|nr:sulfite exporter TauE/SafE family protein [uncultured Pelagimonas sp.]
MLEMTVLFVAGFVAGILNAVAGGGTFLTFPALVWFGLPPVLANATSTLAAMPGYASAAWAFRHDVGAEGPLKLPAIIALATLGAVIGALLLIVTPSEVFTGVVPWLLLLATVLFGAGPAILRFAKSRGIGQAGLLVSALVILLVAIYGGYFNGGLGIMLLAAFSLLGYQNLHGMNGLKNLISAIISVVSSVAFISAGLIVWKPALVIAVAITIGGYVGASQSRRIKNQNHLRWFVTGVGAITTVIFFLP